MKPHLTTNIGHLAALMLFLLSIVILHKLGGFPRACHIICVVSGNYNLSLCRIGSAVVQILRGVTFALCLSLLVMLLLITIVVCYDKLDVCGPYCRHSPLATLYSMLNPHWQFRSLYRPI